MSEINNCLKKITIITDCDTAGEVTVTFDGKTVILPVGVEITVDDNVFSAVTAQHRCAAGFYAADATAIAALPTTGIADGSYAFNMATQIVKFLSGGAWV